MVFKYFIVILLLNSTALLTEEPWGTDAELVTSHTAEKSHPSFLSGFETIIAFHHQVLTHADGPRSHFYPSSSTYMLHAIEKYGFLTGFSYGCDRLMRENDARWIYPLIRTKDGHFLKLDPVP